MRLMPLALLFALACGESTPSAPTFEPSIEAPADVAAAPEDAKKTESGLAYKVMQKGPGGDKPTTEGRVKVHYTGWTTDGERFDSSREKGDPAEFGVTQVIKGWTEGLQLMSPGDHYRFWIPEDLAYKGRPNKPAGMLVFDVELIEYKGPPKAPENLEGPPADAKKTESGLAYKVLSAGDGGDHPAAGADVKAHYSGWTTDGKMFDSSWRSPKPRGFNLNGVIAGWTEGLQLMSTGDKYRFWIPEELAYKGEPNKPAGMLIFDVELVEFKNPPAAPADVAEAPADATATASGLKYKVVKAGPGGPKPTKDMVVAAHYAGWTTDGANFDYSRKRGDDPTPFPLDGVIPGWTEGLQLMSKGDTYRFWIPPEMAYEGKRGPQGTLVFDVELVDMAARPDFAVAADAKKEESGLQWKLLSDAKTGKTPEKSTKVTGSWTAWSEADGGRYLHSNLAQKPSDPQRLRRSLAGLNEGITKMHVGEKARFWIPEDLAFAGRPQAPGGMVIVDFELVSIEE